MPERALFYLFVLLVVLVPAFFVAAAIRSARAGKLPRQEAKRFREVMRRLGGQEVGKGIILTRDGMQYRFHFFANSEGPSHIRVSRKLPQTPGAAAMPELPRLLLREENDRDRLGKRLRLNREIQTGDAWFDERVYIESDEHRGAAARILAEAGVRAGVSGLIAAGYQSVGFRIHRHPFCATWIVGARAFDADVVEETLTQMARIATSLPPFRRTPDRAPMGWGLKVTLTTWLVALVAVVVFLVLSERWMPLSGGLNPLTAMIGLVLFSLHTVVVWLLVHGRSRALRHFVASAAAGLVLGPAIARAVLVTLNGANDSVITTYERALDHKRKVKHDDSTSYYLYFEPIPGVEDSSMRMSVSSREWAAAEEGDRYLLTVGAGELGTPWLVALERE